MIEVSVSEDDRFRWSVRAKTRFRGFDDLPRPSGKAGIDQGPGTTGAPEKINIHKADRKPSDIGRYTGDRGHRGNVTLLIVESQDRGFNFVQFTILIPETRSMESSASSRVLILPDRRSRSCSRRESFSSARRICRICAK